MTGPDSPAREPLRIERTFSAPAQVVFDAWTSVDVLRRWWPAGEDWETVVAEVDVRVGGRLRLVSRTPAGETYGGGGHYTEVVPPERLAFTWSWDDPAQGRDQLVSVTFTDNADGTTTVVLINTGIPDGNRDGHSTGWRLSLDHLDALLHDDGERGAP